MDQFYRFPFLLEYKVNLAIELCCGVTIITVTLYWHGKKYKNGNMPMFEPDALAISMPKANHWSSFWVTKEKTHRPASSFYVFIIDYRYLWFKFMLSQLILSQYKNTFYFVYENSLEK